MWLNDVREWAPFHLDALGLVSILGASVVDRAIGSLVRHPLTDFLPVLGAYTVVSNHILHPLPGYCLYNVTDGMVARDLSSWFTRWLASQHLNNQTVLAIYRDEGRQSHVRGLLGLLIGFAFSAGLITLTIFMRDWYGLANSIFMTVSVLVRFGLCTWYRAISDKNTCKAEPIIDHQLNADRNVKLYVTTPSGDSVSILTTRNITQNILLTTPRPHKSESLHLYQLHNTIRAVGWFAYGGHIVVLGMTTLVNQIIVIAILISATVILSSGIEVGKGDVRIGNRLKITTTTYSDTNKSHQELLALMNLSKDQEDTFVSWTLMPARYNEFWWGKYEVKKATYEMKKAITTFLEAAAIFEELADDLQEAQRRRSGTTIDAERILNTLQSVDIEGAASLELQQVEEVLKDMAQSLRGINADIEQEMTLIGGDKALNEIAVTIGAHAIKIPWVVPVAPPNDSNIAAWAERLKNAATKYYTLATNLQPVPDNHHAVAINMGPADVTS